MIITAWLYCIVCTAFYSTHAASFTSRRDGLWSDPGTWGTNISSVLPGPGDQVFIASGTRVIFDVAGASVISTNIQPNAVLTCPRNADLSRVLVLELELLHVEARGCFSCGYGDCLADSEPFAGAFTLRLRSSYPPDSADTNVRTVLVEDGGRLHLRGVSRASPIARLNSDADVGQTRLKITADGDISAAFIAKQHPWEIGDRLAIAPTDWHPTQTEYHTVVGISDNGENFGDREYTITLADGLEYARSGRTFRLINRADGNRIVVLDARAEIALLSRNVVVEGTDDAVHGLGGDLMIVGPNARARLSWVELRQMGRRGQLGRYPLHIHNLGDGGRNVYVANVAVHSSYQRGIVIHCTNGATLVNNTVAGTHGFGYMLEDGTEEINVLIGNFAIDIRPAAGTPLLQTERVNPAGFWFSNMANVWRDNVAAGVSGAGFSLDMDEVLADRPTSLTTCRDSLPRVNTSINPDRDHAAFNTDVYMALMRKRFVQFANNVAHSTFSGLWMTYPFEDGWNYHGGNPLTRPGRIRVSQFTAWKIGARRHADVQLTDGVGLIFEGCVHLRNPRRVLFERLTCLDAHRATWSSHAATFNGATLGRLDDIQNSGGPKSAESHMIGMMISYMEPQTFARTHVHGEMGYGLGFGPLFVTGFKGQRLAPHNVLRGLSFSGGESTTPFPLIQLTSGDLQVYTDELGDAYGAGPGAMVAASCSSCLTVDPLVEAHAPGMCAVPPANIDITNEAFLPNGRIISTNGGVPMLCHGSEDAGESNLRFVVLTLDFDRQSFKELPARIEMQAIVERGSFAARRTLKTPELLLPLTSRSMAHFRGYKVSIHRVNQFPKFMDVTLGPTTRLGDGMTFVISGASYLTRVTGSTTGTSVVNGTGATCARLLACEHATSSQESAWKWPHICACRALDVPDGELYVRLNAAITPTYLGTYAADGSERPLYVSEGLRIFFS